MISENIEEETVEHRQFLNKAQDDFTNSIQWAFRGKRKTFIRKSKAIQMIIDYCIKNNIKPEEFIK